MADVVPVLSQPNIVAKDFDATLDFYRRLSVGVPDGVNLPDGTRHGQVTFPNGFVLEFDNQTLARTYNAAWGSAEANSRALIEFSLPTRDAVDERYAQLVAAGYEGRQPPYDAFWGARYAVVADPDGNDVGLMSLDEERRACESPTPWWPSVDGVGYRGKLGVSESNCGTARSYGPVLYCQREGPDSNEHFGVAGVGVAGVNVCANRDARR